MEPSTTHNQDLFYYTMLDPNIYGLWYPGLIPQITGEYQVEAGQHSQTDISSNFYGETLFSSQELANDASLLPISTPHVLPEHVNVFSEQELRELKILFDEQPSSVPTLDLPTRPMSDLLQVKPPTYAASAPYKRRRTCPAKEHASILSKLPLPNEPVETIALRLAVVGWLMANPESKSTAFTEIAIPPPAGSTNYNFLLALMKQHNGQHKWSCYGCGFETTRSDRAEGHMRAHFGHKPYLCEGEDGCGKSDCHARFTSKKDLTTHRTELRKAKVHCQYCCEPKLSKNMKRHIEICRLKHPSKSSEQAKLALPSSRPIHGMDRLQHIVSSPNGPNIYSSQGQSSLLGKKRKREWDLVEQM